jgi:purine-binding chemotaxis protein CheW
MTKERRMVVGTEAVAPAYLLIISIGERTAAFPVERVVELFRMVAIEPLPDAPEWILGVVNLRGTLVPVADLRMRLGLGARPYGLDTPMIICRQNERLVAVVADAAEEVVALTEEDVFSPDELMGDDHPLVAVAHMGDKMVPVLDVDRVCAGTETLVLPELDGPAG